MSLSTIKLKECVKKLLIHFLFCQIVLIIAVNRKENDEEMDIKKLLLRYHLCENIASANVIRKKCVRKLLMIINQH